MNVMFRVLVVCAVMLAVSTLAVAEDQIDRDIGRQAAATAVAETLITDRTYGAFLGMYYESPEMQEYVNSETVKKAVDADKQKAQDAILAASQQIIPKAVYIQGMAAALAEKFTYTDLKQILTFVRSDVGKRYVGLAQDQQFTETMFGAMFKGKDTPDPRPVLEKELKARFPPMTFKF